jgi:MFS family permease
MARHLPRNSIPVGKDTFGVLPRVLAAVGSGVGATVIVVGALWSASRFARRRREPGAARRAGANALIAVGTLVLSSGGLIQGFAGKDEAFTITLAAGIVTIYLGFLVAERPRQPERSLVSPSSSRRSTLPTNDRGSASTTSTRAGHL